MLEPIPSKESINTTAAITRRGDSTTFQLPSISRQTALPPSVAQQPALPSLARQPALSSVARHPNLPSVERQPALPLVAWHTALPSPVARQEDSPSVACELALPKAVVELLDREEGDIYDSDSDSRPGSAGTRITAASMTSVDSQGDLLAKFFGLGQSESLVIDSADPPSPSPDARSMSVAKISLLEVLFRSIADKIDHGICLIDVTNGRILYSNTLFSNDLVRMTADKINGRFISCFLSSDDLLSNVLKSIQEMVSYKKRQRGYMLSGAEQSGFVDQLIVNLKYHDGSKLNKRIMEINVDLVGELDNPVFKNLALIHFFDYENKLKLLTEAALSKAFFQTSPVAQIGATTTGILQLMNDSAARIFAVNPAVMTRGDKHIHDLMADSPIRSEHPRIIETFGTKIKANPHYHSPIVGGARPPLKMKRVDGTEITITISVSLIPGNSYMIANIISLQEYIPAARHIKAIAKNSFPLYLYLKYFDSQDIDLPSNGKLIKKISGRTILSIDFVQSTRKFSKLTGKQHYDIIDPFISVIDEAISSLLGAIINHTGDGQIALFDPLFEETNHTLFAIYAAFYCLMVTEEYNKKHPYAGEPDFYNIRIGIARCTLDEDVVVAVFGNASSLTNANITGPMVNMACNLQNAAEPGSILINDEGRKYTYHQTPKVGSLFTLSPQQLKAYDQTMFPAYTASLNSLNREQRLDLTSDINKKQKSILDQKNLLERPRIE